jgi:hypothetical protein
MTDHPTPERAAPEHRVATPSGADVAFADLIYADTELLHVEFDAIIAANFPVWSVPDSIDTRLGCQIG